MLFKSNTMNDCLIFNLIEASFLLWHTIMSL